MNTILNLFVDMCNDLGLCICSWGPHSWQIGAGGTITKHVLKDMFLKTECTNTLVDIKTDQLRDSKGRIKTPLSLV